MWKESIEKWQDGRGDGGKREALGHGEGFWAEGRVWANELGQ